ncbi:SdiA-regulated domain-containing protein [Solitalea canadensis]|uniref:SdiA-regulated family protein n=1 Tax=Solitalea canadensis (strain ATCC 29591 / DSM 3403 / JCM 21819 / LMG 8368 / NBRC 15130 / NCIMB 12057 / USAM 9D) TaxID=929556 RepID=H8KVM9_SOLCM|nr:SdiA-regulated domain-containing protein [Solitalea canadensis]AFD06532.1 hypothetical protein Solca_1448 [Solitalea canadensis DSM 3403]
MIKFYFLITGLAITVLTFACNPDSKAQKNASPKGYNLVQPDDKITFNELLDEISGIAFYPDGKKLAAINDEEGYLFTIDLQTKKADEGVKFGKSGDYEDICNVNGVWYVLKSNGAIYQLRDTSDHKFTHTEYDFPEKTGYEFESLYHDKSSNNLVIICKKCSNDDGVVSAFSFDLATHQFNRSPVFQITITDDLSEPTGKKKEKKGAQFQPSAAEIHPVTGQLYILSHQQKRLIITDLKGKIESVYKLDPKLFKQPEGIAFSSNGDLYISNEAKNSFANIYKFSYKP